MDLPIFEFIYLAFGKDFRLELDHFIVVQHLILKFHLVVILKFPFDYLQATEFQDEIKGSFNLVVGIHEFEFIIFSLFIYAEITGPAFICLEELSLHFAYLFAVVDDGDISVVGDVEHQEF
jgi:hypothetical protein